MVKKPHPNIRKTIKWGGAAVTVLLVVVWAGTVGEIISWGGCGPRHLGWAIGNHCAYVSFVTEVRGIGPDWCIGLPPSRDHVYGLNHETYVLQASDPKAAASFPSYSQEIYSIALWIPALALLAMSATTWFLDRRMTRGQRADRCPTCNYDRAGIGAGAVCPECGSKPA